MPLAKISRRWQGAEHHRDEAERTGDLSLLMGFAVNKLVRETNNKINTYILSFYVFMSIFYGLT